MQRLFLSYLLLIIPILASSQTRPLVLSQVTIIDVKDGQLYPKMSVIIENNHIVKIGKNPVIPKNALVIDARGKYLIPGLWDMHVHLSFYGQKALGLLLANGITGVRDMGGNLEQLNQWQAQINQHNLYGPRIKRCGPFVDGFKKMSPIRETVTKMPADEQAARLLVDSLQAAGVDHIKGHSRLSRSVFLAIADEAHKKNVPFVVHLSKEVSTEEAIAAGVHCIEHTESLLGSAIYEPVDSIRLQQTRINLNKLYSAYGDSLARSISDHHIFFTPTVSSLYKLKGSDYEKWLAPKLLPVITKLHAAKVKLLTGSDFATAEAGIRPGIDLHDELVLFTQAGLTNLEALQAATIHPAECVNMLESLGSITEGKIADLVLLNSNPLQDIHRTRDIFAVIANGRFLSGKQLKQLR